jgi:WD40 repeat protein
MMSFPSAEMEKTSAIKPRKKLRGHTGYVLDVAHLPGRQHIITCSGDASLRLWDLDSSAQIGKDWRDDSEEAGIFAIALSPNCKAIATGSSDGTVTLWDVEGRKVIARWTGHIAIVRSVCWSADGERVLSGSYDGTVRVWDVEIGETVLGPIKTGHENVTAAIYSHNATKIATGGGNESNGVKIWDAKTGELLSTILTEHDEQGWSLAWTT